MTLYLHGCKLPCGYRELNLGPLEEQSLLLPSEPLDINEHALFSTLYSPL